MKPLQALLLGVLQGVTEFLPVSSSGHLLLVRGWMNLAEIPPLFDVILHLATLLVVLWVFRRRVGDIIRALWHGISGRLTEEDRPNLRLAGLLAAASASTAVLGFLIIRMNIRPDPALVCVFFLVTSCLLIATAFTRGARGLDEMGWGRALIIGTVQGFGLFAGISRSGATIAAGLLLGLNRKSAGEFSFLLSLPAVTGAFLLTLKDAAALSAVVPPLSLTLGFLAALLSGYAALRLLLWLLRGGRLWFFAFYLVPLGIIGLILF